MFVVWLLYCKNFLRWDTIVSSDVRYVAHEAHVRTAWWSLRLQLWQGAVQGTRYAFLSQDPDSTRVNCLDFCYVRECRSCISARIRGRDENKDYSGHRHARSVPWTKSNVGVWSWSEVFIDPPEAGKLYLNACRAWSSCFIAKVSLMGVQCLRSLRRVLAYWRTIQRKSIFDCVTISRFILVY